MGNTCIAGGSSTQRIMSAKDDLTRANRSPSLFMFGWYTYPLNRAIARRNCVLALEMCVFSFKDGFHTAERLQLDSMKCSGDGKTPEFPNGREYSVLRRLHLNASSEISFDNIPSLVRTSGRSRPKTHTLKSVMLFRTGST